MSDFGSGDIGDWTQNSRDQSPSTDLFAALADSNGFYIVGDSIANGCKAKLQAMFTAHGNASGYNVWSGRPTTPAVDWVQAARDASGLPANLLMVTGANDVFHPPAVRDQITRLMGVVGPERRVWWVTVNVGRAGWQPHDQRNSGLVNSYLWQAAGAHPNLRIIDWARFLAEKPGRITAYTPDGVHPDSDDGQAAFTATVERVVYAGAAC